MSTHPAQQEGTGVTVRSLLVGCAVVVLISLGAPHSIWTFGSSEMTWSFFPIGVGFLFVCLIFANALLKILNFNWALRPAEMITVVVMGLVCTGIPVFLIGYFLAIPTTPYYFASAENQWGTYVLPYLPTWLLPSNDGLAMTWFFEGLPIGEPTPWGTLLAAWAMPLFWWLSFIWTLYLVCFCVVVLLRKQWIERERLAYPLMEVPQALGRARRQVAAQPAHCPPRLCFGHCLGRGAVLCGFADQSHLHGLRTGGFQLQLLDLPRLLGRRRDGLWRRDGQDQGPGRFPRAKVGLLWHWRGGDVRFDVYAVSLSVVASAPGGLGHFRDLDGAQPSPGDLRGVGSQKSDHALWRH